MAPSDQESLSIQVTGDAGSIPGLGRAPGEGNGNLLQNSGKSHRQRNLVGYSPWGHKESDTTKHTLLVVNLRKVMLFFSLPKHTGMSLFNCHKTYLECFIFIKIIPQRFTRSREHRLVKQNQKPKPTVLTRKL